MAILQFIFSSFWTCIGTLILVAAILNGVAQLIRAMRGVPEPPEVRETNEIECSEVLERVEGGVYKRIDENRELVELIQREAPQLFATHPWALGWLKSQDRFLVALSESDDFDADECQFKKRDEGERPMPRPIPMPIQ